VLGFEFEFWRTKSTNFHLINQKLVKVNTADEPSSWRVCVKNAGRRLRGEGLRLDHHRRFETGFSWRWVRRSASPCLWGFEREGKGREVAGFEVRLVMWDGM
jgi:hypothetical protein